MVEKIIPQLQHANLFVVLAVICVIVAVMSGLDAKDKRTFLLLKMSVALTTPLSSQPVLQFIVPRNVSLLIRTYPALMLD